MKGQKFSFSVALMAFQGLNSHMAVLPHEKTEHSTQPSLQAGLPDSAAQMSTN